MVPYLDSLFKVQNLPVDLIADHSSIHLRIHHLDGRHGLKQAKPSIPEIWRQMIYCHCRAETLHFHIRTFYVLFFVTFTVECRYAYYRCTTVPYYLGNIAWEADQSLHTLPIRPIQVSHKVDYIIYIDILTVCHEATRQGSVLHSIEKEQVRLVFQNCNLCLDKVCAGGLKQRKMPRLKIIFR